MSPREDDGTSTNNYVIVYEEAQDTGTYMVGALKNSGPNSITVKLTTKDTFRGVEQAVESTVAAGTTWDIASALVNPARPYCLYRIEVKSTLADLSGNFRMVTD